MRLEAENKSPIQNATAADVRAALSKLRSYGPSSYASLTDVHGSYLQVAGGGVTCMLEWRDAVTGHHFRAHNDTPNKVFPDGTILSFSGGEVKLKSDEWLTIPTVEKAFLAFLASEPLSSLIKWRDISAIFESAQIGP
jgi:hypothetical protein